MTNPTSLPALSDDEIRAYESLADTSLLSVNVPMEDFRRLLQEVRALRKQVRPIGYIDVDEFYPPDEPEQSSPPATTPHE